MVRDARPRIGRREALLGMTTGLVLGASHGSWAAPGPAEASSTIHLDLPQLQYPGAWSPREGAMRVLARELRLRTRLEPIRTPSTVEATSPALFETPFLYVAGDEGLPSFAEGARSQLRRFVDLGGFILFDAASGGADSGFVRDASALLETLAPGSTVSPVAHDHVLYRSFYLVDFPWGRTGVHDHVLGVQDEGRLKAIVVGNDLGGALSESQIGIPAYPCTPGGALQRERAIRFAVNILLYATCTDYKADRAHVETLLRSGRRRH